MSHRIDAKVLRAHVAHILGMAGSSRAEAEQVADNLVMANLSGHDSHGVGMVPRYVDAVIEGGLVPNTDVAVRLDGGAMLALDGQKGYGQITGVQTMEMAIARAHQHGVCVAALSNTHHLGRIGHFAEIAVAQGLVSMHFVNVISRPVVAPHGGGDGRFGTNPFCVGIPMGEDPAFLLDFATSRVAQGKMRVAHNEGRHVPQGYLIDSQGHPTTDPGVVVVPQANGLMGALMTFGEHKGYGLAAACELLGGALTGGGTWHHAPNSKRAVINNMLTVVIDPGKLGGRDTFIREAQAFADWVQKSPAAPDSEGVLLAGAPERRARQLRERDGIEIDEATWSEIEAAAVKVGA